ncbi:chaperone protein DnaK [Candidatus Kuenenia stuttgartiensis]|uniref:Chaperone protein DnaK n=1 Tax=Kuenenia stuttgartiensis TaxID=174633 RepID=Q1Q021_KUEST|nr:MULTISPECIES: Hsp70 family protein [Kuenenia]MCF6151294.1 heat-shock protein Hsp70 [Candidatus Kuenenia stuttgartiensis]MCL4726193.1 Hsp70 family protein [Candidatus Kuenenia stuttgartiensis]MCZ7621819.1 Hsp70 family protein [Candidatus Kuenenia sp.]QII09932.1 chaperone protein DnaK [Candidatus Kuenenia stuttgartiensis]CAJ72688.1 strongly similar to molecular chaperone DnaK [Candidatus Kuenenia stuttgartiensis]
METIVGIDLGTTNSEISILENGKPKVIPVDDDLIMPSCVGIDITGKLIVGKTAKNQAVSSPESTIFSIKRKMGEDVKVRLGEKEFRPEEISSFILLTLKKHAEKYLGSEIKKAVITVPAYFDDRQRNATRDAGLLAGLDVVRIINEPTSAAIAYDAGHPENHKLLVYDLGGGTFDVSLVVVENGVVEVLASHGDTKLGGDDFDQLLFNHVLQVFKKEHGVDLNEDIRARRRLLNTLEKAKRELSDHPFAKIREEFISKELHLEMEISRNDYESMIRPLLQKTLDCIHMCLKDASFIPGDIDKVILVGGSTRTPLVHEIITKEIGIEPHYEINPDLIVSMGAAIQGGIIAGHKTQSILVDITPYTFGTSAVGDYDGAIHHNVFVPIIKRNTPLPVSKGEVFGTMVDNQEAVEVNIYQGEEPLAEDNIFIGNFMVQGLSEAPAGNKIILNLELDINGILKVTAVEKNTGLSKEVTMDTKDVESNFNIIESQKNVASLFSEEEFDSEEFKLITKEDGGHEAPAEESDAIARTKDLRRRAEKLMDSISLEDENDIRNLLEKSEKAVNEHDLVGLSEINESLEDIIFYLEE